MLNYEDRLIFLSKFLRFDIYELIRKYINNQSKSQQKQLSLTLVQYVELIYVPFNNDETNELILSLTYIRADLCQRYKIKAAKDCYRHINLLIEHMLDQGCFKKELVDEQHSLTCTLTKSQYEACKSEKIPLMVSVKFNCDLTKADVTDSTKSQPPSLKVEQRLEYLSSFLSNEVSELLVNFVYQSNSVRQTQLTFTLVVYIEVLHEAFNKNDTNKLTQSLSYIRTDLCQKYPLLIVERKFSQLRILLKHMLKASYFHEESVEELTTFFFPISKTQYEISMSESIPEEVSAQFKHDFRVTDIRCREKNHKLSINVEEKLNRLSGILNEDISELIINFLYQSNKEQQTQLTFKLVIYIGVLHEALNNNDTDKLIRSLTYIRSDLCQRHTFKTAKSVLVRFQMLVKHIIKAGYFNEGSVDQLATFLVPFNELQFEISKSETIPKKISNLFAHEPNAEESFKEALNSCCTREIATRLEEHVNTFKVKKHHRAPLILFLKQISESNPEWHKHTRVIEGELLKFRSNLLDNLQRNTAYGRFQNVKNSIDVLVKHGLLSNNLDMPDNLRRCTNTEKVRKNNPLICEVDMYDETKRESYINSRKFIQSIECDLSNNLNILVADAQEIVYRGYQKFCEKESFIAQSQFDEFINHPELLVNNTKGNNGKSKVNPFYDKHPMRTKNLTAYYNHFFDDMVHGRTQHKMTSLSISEEILGYLGLTANVASAMQIIITEELGINPYSLYRVKISSKGHGSEFVKIDDEGSVRIKALKPRARSSHPRKAVGTFTPLANINANEINAATCLKMTLEMTSRTRKYLGVKELWVCLTVTGSTVASLNSFQTQFKKIVKQASSKSTTLQYATLKKVRSSKGVLIYIQTNGDSLKTAAFFGNTVKTTLSRYIPKYLTELVYRVKIRNFQNIFLFMAISSDESPAESLNMSDSDFKFQLKQAFKNPDMGGNLYEKLTQNPTENEENTPLYFCISDLNLQLAIKYAKYGEDKELKNNCKNVLNKIGEESPVVIKSMLRKAQLAVEQEK
ncbi:hypothetical protein AB4622_05565 [Vibrio splendidus]